ncbi:MAG: hypothetical protein HOY79_49325 [Streptomyces sp.]|nr:hypothetical protein [Streptomyces sp.]
MTAGLWTTSELPGLNWDPEPDEDDDGPWCRIPSDLGGQGVNPDRLLAMTTITTTGNYL